MSVQNTNEQHEQTDYPCNELKKIDIDIWTAFIKFIKTIHFGTFSFIMQDKKIIGYDQSIKERKKNSRG